MENEIVNNNIQFIVEIIGFIVTIIIAVGSAVISFFKAKQDMKLEIMKLKDENLFEIKKEAILESLNFIDDYISWLGVKDQPDPIRKTSIDINNMTLRAREIYNKLSITCSNNEILESLMKLILVDDKEGNIFVEYNFFRNLCRKELGLEIIHLDNKNVFISRIAVRKTNEKE